MSEDQIRIRTGDSKVIMVPRKVVMRSTVFYDMLNAEAFKDDGSAITLDEPHSALKALFACMDSDTASLHPSVPLLRAVAKAYDKYDIPLVGYVIREEARKLLKKHPHGALALAGDQGSTDLARDSILAFKDQSHIPTLACQICINSYNSYHRSATDKCCCGVQGYKKLESVIKSLDGRTAASLLHAMWQARAKMTEEQDYKDTWEKVALAFEYLPLS